MSSLRTTPLFVAVLVAGCGMGPFADPGGGDDSLPQSGAGPYLFAEPDFDTTADEPYVLAQAAVSLTDPAIRVTDDGDYEVFFTRTDDDGSEIWKVTLQSLDTLPDDEPTLVLRADAAWEGSVVRAPSITVLDDAMYLYYEGGDEAPAIGLARSTDGGRSFVKEAGNPILLNAKDPDVARAGGEWLMVHGEPAGETISICAGSDGVTFDDPRALISARLGLEGAFDANGVSAPALRVRSTATGRLHYGLFYSGLGTNRDGDLVSGIGYQGSFDTEHWVAFLDGEPILQAGFAGAGGPAPVIGGTESLLFVHQRKQGRGRVAVSYGP